MKGIKVTEIGKEVKFKRIWGKLEPEKGFERPSVRKYLRLTLVFMWISALRKGLISVLQEFFASINKFFHLTGRLGTRLSFFGGLALSSCFLISKGPKSYVVRQLLRHVLYTMFLSNNRASFQLWWKESLVKHQKVSKDHATDGSYFG